MKLIPLFMKRSPFVERSSIVPQGLILVLLIFLLWFAIGSNRFIMAAQLSASSDKPAVVEDSDQSLSTLDASTIPSEKVSQFVRAYLQVLELVENRQPELRSAETSIESQRIEGEIEAEAREMIEKAGLTKPEYLQLLTLANIDPEFGERIAAGLEEASQ